MSSFWVALSGLITPGFAHALLSQRRAMMIVIGLAALSVFGMLLVPWSAYLGLFVIAGSMVEAGLRHRRLRPSRLNWKLALLAFGGMLAFSYLARVLIVEAFKIPGSSGYPTLQIDDHIFINKLAMRVRGPERGEIIVFRMPCQPDRDYIKRVIALEDDTVEVRCNVVYVDGTPVQSKLIEAKDRYLDRYEGDDRWVEQRASRYRETIGDHTFDVFHDDDRPQRDEAQRAGTVIGGDSRDFPHERLDSLSCTSTGEPWMKEATNQVPGRIVETAPEATDPCKPHRHFVVPKGHVFVMGDNRPNSNDSRVWGAVPVENVKGPATGLWYPFGRIGRLE